VKFIFQPAEEGAPEGEKGGADLMIAEGALDDPHPGAIFGLHVIPTYDVGQVAFRAGGMMASADRLKIVVHGNQSHGAKPWLGTDPIVIASQIVLGLQTIASRQIDVTLAPAIITIGAINGGIRFNIIPDEVEMIGTIRTFDTGMQKDIHDRIRRTAKDIAESAGATAEVEIVTETPVTYNDPDLTRMMTPTVQAVVGGENALETRPQTWAEDFACYQKEIPGLFVYLGVRTPGAKPEDFPSNHSPRFMADEDAMVVGVRLLSFLAVDYLARGE
jgi:amidohydrolase